MTITRYCCTDEQCRLQGTFQGGILSVGESVQRVKENVGGMGQGKTKIFPNVSTQYI